MDNPASSSSSSNVNEANQELIDYLRECGVCEICQLRYLKVRGNDYDDPKKTFENLKVSLEKKHQAEENEEAPNKKLKPNTCPTCLGLFTEKVQNELIEAILKAKIDEYDYDGIVTAITTPIILHVRQLAMWHALLKKFPNSVSAERSPDVPLKEAAKLILNPIICKKLKKNYNTEGISINIVFKHALEDETIAKFRELHDYKTDYSHKGKKQEISRTLLEKHYQPLLVDAEMFGKFFEIPPTIVDDTLYLDKVDLTGPILCVAGRYRKFSRTLSHTPWVVNGRRMKDDSIEEILIRNIAPFFCDDTSKVVFMSSGREDVDVRCLGRGRPFLLEIPNSKHAKLKKIKAYELEKAVDRSCLVNCRDLQIVPKEEQINIKTGEEHKKKVYRALCKLEKSVTTETIDTLNGLEEFEIEQKTPLRVLHRRPLLTRKRKVYSIKARIDGRRKNILILDIATQAGTYIKELIHGDFGRTIPCIASIIDKEVDIVALDVVDIDLDWPKAIDNSIIDPSEIRKKPLEPEAQRPETPITETPEEELPPPASPSDSEDDFDVYAMLGAVRGATPTPENLMEPLEVEDEEIRKARMARKAKKEKTSATSASLA